MQNLALFEVPWKASAPGGGARQRGEIKKEWKEKRPNFSQDRI
jgi:hypothetical protein